MTRPEAAQTRGLGLGAAGDDQAAVRGRLENQRPEKRNVVVDGMGDGEVIVCESQRKAESGTDLPVVPQVGLPGALSQVRAVEAHAARGHRRDAEEEIRESVTREVAVELEVAAMRTAGAVVVQLLVSYLESEVELVGLAHARETRREACRVGVTRSRGLVAVGLPERRVAGYGNLGISLVGAVERVNPMDTQRIQQALLEGMPGEFVFHAAVERRLEVHDQARAEAAVIGQREVLVTVFLRGGKLRQAVDLELAAVGETPVAEELRLPAELVIRPDADRVPVFHGGLVVGEIRIHVAAIGLRDRRQHLQCHGVQAVVRDAIARKRISRERIDNGLAQAAEVSGAHFRRGHERGHGRALVDPQPVVRSENLQSARDEYAQSGAELVALVFRQLLSDRVEEVAGVEKIVAVIFVDRAVVTAAGAHRKEIDDLDERLRSYPGEERFEFFGKDAELLYFGERGSGGRFRIIGLGRRCRGGGRLFFLFLIAGCRLQLAVVCRRGRCPRRQEQEKERHGENGRPIAPAGDVRE